MNEYVDRNRAEISLYNTHFNKILIFLYWFLYWFYYISYLLHINKRNKFN